MNFRSLFKRHFFLEFEIKIKTKYLDKYFIFCEKKLIFSIFYITVYISNFYVCVFFLAYNYFVFFLNKNMKQMVIFLIKYFWFLFISIMFAMIFNFKIHIMRFLKPNFVFYEKSQFQKSFFWRNIQQFLKYFSREFILFSLNKCKFKNNLSLS